MHLYYKIQFALLLFCVMGHTLTAQHEIRGIIKDKTTSEPLIGATILEVSTGNGTITDAFGAFILNASTPDPEVQVSYTGYSPLELKLTEGEEAEILLVRDAVMLDDIVVTGLGVKRQKRELGYSTDNVSGDDIVLSNAPNVVNALSGRSAGVQVVSPNGVDGGTTRIVIRGNNNIRFDESEGSLQCCSRGESSSTHVVVASTCFLFS